MSGNQKRRVLIAEEDRVVADLLSLALRELGCEVKVTTQESVVRDGLIQWKPDLLILDLFLPGTSSLDLVRECTAIGKKVGRSIPVLVISSLGFKEVVEQAREFGAVDFVLKPVDLDIFRRKALMYLP